MSFFKITKRCPYCASKLNKDGKCTCDVFKAVEAAKQKEDAANAGTDNNATTSNPRSLTK